MTRLIWVDSPDNSGIPIAQDWSDQAFPTYAKRPYSKYDQYIWATDEMLTGVMTVKSGR